MHAMRRSMAPQPRPAYPLITQAVVSDLPTCGGVTYAQSHGVAALTYPAPKKGGYEGLTTEQLVEQLKGLGVEYVLLAGYLKVTTGRTGHLPPLPENHQTHHDRRLHCAACSPNPPPTQPPPQHTYTI